MPDRHFKDNYKKQYAKNYERLMNRRQERAERKASKKPASFNVIKQQIVGGIVFGIVVFSVFLAGSFLSNIYAEKQSTIAKLETEIQSIDDIIKEYQIIDSDEKYEQIDEAILRISDLQNQYVSDNFDETFDTYADRYLGQYNSNWADDIDDLTNPVWKGYLDQSCDFRESADMLFILYDKSIPRLVVNVRFGIDNFGNLGEMTYMDKAALI